MPLISPPSLFSFSPRHDEPQYVLARSDITAQRRRVAARSSPPRSSQALSSPPISPCLPGPPQCSARLNTAPPGLFGAGRLSLSAEAAGRVMRVFCSGVAAARTPVDAAPRPRSRFLSPANCVNASRSLLARAAPRRRCGGALFRNATRVPARVISGGRDGGSKDRPVAVGLRTNLTSKLARPGAGTRLALCSERGEC